jgi:hypothetical protein
MTQEEDEGDDPNLEIFEMETLDLSESGGKSGNENCERGCDDVSCLLDLDTEAEKDPK